MPTPSPIMVASVGAALAKVTTPATMPTTPIPTSTATSAHSSGSTAASTLPKTSSRITRAAPMPTSSLLRSLAGAVVTWSRPPP